MLIVVEREQSPHFARNLTWKGHSPTPKVYEATQSKKE